MNPEQKTRLSIKEIIREVLYGYGRMGKGLLMLFSFLILLVLLSLVIVFPLQKLAVNLRFVYNIITGALLGGLLLFFLVKRVNKVGWKRTLGFLGLFASGILLMLIKEQWLPLSLPLSLLYLGILFLVRRKGLLSPEVCGFLIFLCYLNGFYWTSVLIAFSYFYLALPLALLYLFFLGFLLYEKKLYKHRKIFM